MKVCPGPDCLNEISDNLSFCATCKAVLEQAPKMVEELERFLENHARFDAWLVAHHR